MPLTWSPQLPTDRPLVAPSLLAADFGRLGEEIAAVEAAGADLLHVDVMDGRFVPSITLGPVVVQGIRRGTRLFLDVHLMVVEPERHVEAFRDAGADGITVHAEACAELGAVLAAVRASGARVGVALNPDTALDSVRPHLDAIDLLLVMSVFPGRGGQAFIPAVVSKIAAAAQERSARGLDFLIEVDGGIVPETAATVRRAGADVLVAGTAVFRHPPYARPIGALRNAGA